ncbi:protein FAM228B isoform X2 [Numida meleagris]|uniref:protein FAM228B isoform X2 n=1 Tax=Numida meleagris TaxID=8996 RepID=UPI000B3DC9DA|nr:protein FAM228B isoform X2 [Numida meleagris]XP_021247029.1 protein FAM228B isoform X2 [Numida meleagris]XP_021247030.1 protein FAM228B isoform X2 [Numida meleagris]
MSRFFSSQPQEPPRARNRSPARCLHGNRAPSAALRCPQCAYPRGGPRSAPDWLTRQGAPILIGGNIRAVLPNPMFALLWLPGVLAASVEGFVRSSAPPRPLGPGRPPVGACPADGEPNRCPEGVPSSSERLEPPPAMHTADSSGTAPRVTGPPLAAGQGQQKLFQRCPTAPARSNAANTFDYSRFFGKTDTSRYWMMQKDFYRVKAAPDESRDIIASAQSILDRENYFVREVDRYLKHYEFLNLRKKEILYKKWLEDVSEPLLWKFEDKMDSKSREEIQKRREEQLSLYLNYCKKKGYVALEAYDPSEYDPLFLKTCTDCWKVSIPALQDPLLKAVQKKFIETGIVKRCETGRPCSSRELQELPLLPLSRQRVDAIEWLKVPHAYIASELHQTRRLRVVDHHEDSKSTCCYLSSS